MNFLVLAFKRLTGFPVGRFFVFFGTLKEVKDLINKEFEINNANRGSKKIFATLGASNHSEQEREVNDYYATHPKALELLLNEESFSHNIWEPACGGGHLSDVLKQHGHNVKSSDLVDRGYAGTEVIDFFKTDSTTIPDGERWDIITNPPYKHAQQFIEHAMEISPVGTKVAMFLRLQFLESKARQEFFNKYPPVVFYVSRSRIPCAKNGNFENIGRSAVPYAWFIWEKGYNGTTIMKQFN